MCVRINGLDAICPRSRSPVCSVDLHTLFPWDWEAREEGASLSGTEETATNSELSKSTTLCSVAEVVGQQLTLSNPRLSLD